jgi:hypothetical protein
MGSVSSGGDRGAGGGGGNMSAGGIGIGGGINCRCFTEAIGPSSPGGVRVNNTQCPIHRSPYLNVRWPDNPYLKKKEHNVVDLQQLSREREERGKQYWKQLMGNPTVQVFDETLSAQLTRVMNGHENACNTPDFILSEFLVNCFSAVVGYTREREKWYGVNHIPGQSSSLNQSEQNENDLLAIAHYAKIGTRRFGSVSQHEKAVEIIASSLARLGLSKENIDNLFYGDMV